jgi:hypothetical protein
MAVPLWRSRAKNEKTRGEEKEWNEEERIGASVRASDQRTALVSVRD